MVKRSCGKLYLPGVLKFFVFRNYQRYVLLLFGDNLFFYDEAHNVVTQFFRGVNRLNEDRVNFQMYQLRPEVDPTQFVRLKDNYPEYLVGDSTGEYYLGVFAFGLVSLLTSYGTYTKFQENDTLMGISLLAMTSALLTFGGYCLKEIIKTGKR